MAFYQFERTQHIKAELDEVWEFISNPANLKQITPEYMRFDITAKNLPEEMYQGMIIKYLVSPLLGIPTTWVTEITHLEEKKYFVDEQRVGPYKMWHHQHLLEPVNQGVEMKDIVSYRPPAGVLGAIANHFLIKHKLVEIFEHRTKVLETIF